MRCRVCGAKLAIADELRKMFIALRGFNRHPDYYNPKLTYVLLWDKWYLLYGCDDIFEMDSSLWGTEEIVGVICQMMTMRYYDEFSSTLQGNG